MKYEQKLEQWAEREFRRNVDNIIVDDDHRGIIAFGRYHLQSIEAGCVVGMPDDSEIMFSNKKIAMSWCVADKYCQYGLANMIKILDQKRRLLSADVAHGRRQAATARHSDFVETVEAKLSLKISQLQSIDTELDKCIKTAKYFQIRGFSNETARTRVS
jgi:hypothetical protein